MSRFILLAIVLLPQYALATGKAKPYAIDGLTRIVHAGTLLTIPGDKTKTRQSIIIRKGKIEKIHDGYLEKTQIVGDDANERVIDLTQHFVMPGFIDLHVHISKEYGPNDKLDTVTMNDADVALQAAMYAQRTLDVGFTTIRDLGSAGNAVFALRDAIKAGKVPGPKILVAGNAITATGGHGDVHGFRQDVLDVIPTTGTCDGVDACRAAVRRQVKRGADVIKVTATGGVLSETAAGTGQQLTDEELKAIVETAHSLGRKVTAHAHAKEGIEAALRAGFDSIEHAMWADKGTMKLFVKSGAWMIPTIYPITAVGDTPERMKKGPFGHMPPAILDKLLELGRQPKEMAALAYKMGVKIALGTDSGVSPHGENANEFIEYVNIGMSEAEALAAGTIKAAIAGGIDETTGSIEVGKAADIVAMPGNPLQNIEAVLGVSFVMRDGVVFKNE